VFDRVSLRLTLSAAVVADVVDIMGGSIYFALIKGVVLIFVGYMDI